MERNLEKGTRIRVHTKNEVDIGTVETAHNFGANGVDDWYIEYTSDLYGARYLKQQQDGVLKVEVLRPSKQQQFVIDLVPDEDSDGIFASFVWDPETRGYGSTELSAILSLVLCTAEQQEEDLSEQANDLAGMTCIQNQAIEKALERHYGGIIEYR